MRKLFMIQSKEKKFLCKEYLERFPKAALPYAMDYHNNDITYEKYGYDAVESPWHPWKKIIDFYRNMGNIVVDNRVLDETPEIYEPILYKQERTRRRRYRELLEITDVHRRNNGLLKPSGTPERHNVINPIFI